ncbi:hypothetical protein PIB30_002403 [Stylosanthes scabra]|uniref:Exocyst subunit Exo70 family protein n=1 Tax=Stylosanthes scabra TaxID=79078 RepID=A0ABU6W300_9FABA|nr:hypothetical protein [Stylosanthes scabra]
MSLSLSRQIEFGFEVDLFNFFLGYFLVQLMTIHIALASLGALFCYFLMFLRSYLDSKQPPNGSNVSHSVVQITFEIEDPRSGTSKKERLYEILGIEEKRENNVIFPIDMEDKIRKAIFEGGCDEECCNVYITWRRQILDQKMKKIELHKLHIKEIKDVPLDYLQRKIQRWIMAFEYSISILFSEERNLSNSVFLGCSSSSNNADLCFMELCRPPMTLLLDFVSAVANGKGSPLRLFRLLKVFEALKEMLPEIETLFSDQSGGLEIRDIAIGILARLREAIKGVFADLENLICKNEPSIGIVHGGGIHPITHYVMNYLGVVCNKYLMTLEQVFESNNNNNHGMEFYLAKILEMLEKSLKANSKEMYKDSNLGIVFVMNNYTYMVNCMKHSKLGELFGENWIKNNIIAKFRQCYGNYKANSWDQVFREKLSVGEFVMEFEEICDVQSSWVIFDDQLRRQIRNDLKETLLARIKSVIERSQEEVNIWGDFGFEVKDIVTGIDKLFKGRDELKNHRDLHPTWTAALHEHNIKDFHKYWKKHAQKTLLGSSYPM